MKVLKLFRPLNTFILLIIIITGIGLLLPARLIIPVQNASFRSWNKQSFWFYPWGDTRGTHKGIDIFAQRGTNVISPGYGIVIQTGYSKKGGNYIYLLAAKWRVYYFAHLDTILTSEFSLVSQGTCIGRVGNTGNAILKPPHLHFSIITLLPYPWRYQHVEREAWKKMFYLNPEDYFM